MDISYNYLIVSDFHLSEGRDPETGLLQPNEDFFQDAPFARFIAYHGALSRNSEAPDFYEKPWRLVVNGDIFDFLQVVSLPPEGDELLAITGKRRYADLPPNTCKFGLGTSEKEIVWKLEKIAAGHPLFFQALAWLVAQTGNQLILMKGNHDIEIYWPGVQKRLRELLAAAYRSWYTAVTSGDVESPLPLYPGMPAQLAPEQLSEAVRFPRLFLYQRDLFFIEHGCQYDPVNFFYDFDRPRLVDENGEMTDLIELPEGSLFVRYFFNQVEGIHPFADNFKPITRYVFWLLANAPDQFIIFGRIIVAYLRARGKVRAKTRKKVRYKRKVDGRLQNDPFLNRMLQIQEEMREMMENNSGRTTRRMVLSLGLLLLAGLLALLTVRMIAVADYGLTLVALFFMALCYFSGTYLFQSLNHLLTDPYLLTAAKKVAALLNGRPSERIGPVRYFIYGHDHAARMMVMDNKDDPRRPDYRQWYINTGAWIPVFSREEQLTRPAAHLTFLRLVPSRLERDDMPELLRWTEAQGPQPVRIFDKIVQRGCEETGESY